MISPVDAARVERHPEILSTLEGDDMSRLGAILSDAFDSITPSLAEEFIPKAILAESADVLVSRNELGRIASVMLVNVNFGGGKLRGRVDDVATHTDSRREGHAAAVLDFALDWFRERGVSRVNLTSEDSRRPAHKLYRSRGFVTRETNQFQLDLDKPKYIA